MGLESRAVFVSGDRPLTQGAQKTLDQALCSEWESGPQHHSALTWVTKMLE